MSIVETRLTYDQAIRAAERMKGLFPAETYKKWIFCGGIRRKAATMAEIVHLIDPMLDTSPLFRKEDRVLGQNCAKSEVWLKLDQLVAGGVMTRCYLPGAGFLWHDHLRLVVYAGVAHQFLAAGPRNWGL